MWNHMCVISHRSGWWMSEGRSVMWPFWWACCSYRRYSIDDDSIPASRPPKPVDKILADANLHNNSNHLLLQQLFPPQILQHQKQILHLLRPIIIQEQKDNATSHLGYDCDVFSTSLFYSCCLMLLSLSVVVGVVGQSIVLKWTIRRCCTF